MARRTFVVESSSSSSSFFVGVECWNEKKLSIQAFREWQAAMVASTEEHLQEHSRMGFRIRGFRIRCDACQVTTKKLNVLEYQASFVTKPVFTVVGGRFVTSDSKCWSWILVQTKFLSILFLNEHNFRKRKS